MHEFGVTTKLAWKYKTVSGGSGTEIDGISALDSGIYMTIMGIKGFQKIF